MTREKKKVLVLCTGNSCRSQMAEGWIRNDLGRWVDVFSAGTHPCFVHPLAIEAMNEAGVDLSTHWSKSLTEFLDVDFDLVVTVCDNARRACPAFPGAGKQRHIPIPDPVIYGMEGDAALGKFRESRDLIRRSIVPVVEKELDLPSGESG